MSTTAPVKVLSAEDLVPEPNAYDCIVSKEFIFAVDNKFRLFNALKESLTDNGQLQIVDYVLAREDLKSAWLDQWIELDPATPCPWSLKRYTETFENFGFRTLISQDISDDLYKTVSESLSRYMAQIRDNSQDPKMLEVMAREVHIWESRMRLLKEKDLRVFRFHTAKRSNGLRSAG